MTDFSLLKTLTGHQRWVWDAVFSHDSDFLVTASSDQSLRLWDLEQGETIRQYTGHNKAVVCVALEHDPRVGARVGRGAGVVAVRQLATVVEAARLLPHLGHQVPSLHGSTVALSTDNRARVSGARPPRTARPR